MKHITLVAFAMLIIAASSAINADPINYGDTIHLNDWNQKELLIIQWHQGRLGPSIGGKRYVNLSNGSDIVWGVGLNRTINPQDRNDPAYAKIAQIRPLTSGWIIENTDGPNNGPIKSGGFVSLKSPQTNTVDDNDNNKFKETVDSQYLQARNDSGYPLSTLPASRQRGNWERWHIFKVDGNDGDVINSGDKVVLQSTGIATWLNSESGRTIFNVNVNSGSRYDSGAQWTITK